MMPQDCSSHAKTSWSLLALESPLPWAFQTFDPKVTIARLDPISSVLILTITPDSGFYTKLAGMGYSEPEEVFDIHNFDDDPSIFYRLAGDILPDEQIGCSPTHAFIRLLQDKDRLQTNYSQNIDNVEASAGIEPTRLIQCHGSFATASCRRCHHRVQGTEIFEDIRNKRVARCKECLNEITKSVDLHGRSQKRSKTRHFEDSDDDEDDDIPEAGVM